MFVCSLHQKRSAGFRVPSLPSSNGGSPFRTQLYNWGTKKGFNPLLVDFNKKTQESQITPQKDTLSIEKYRVVWTIRNFIAKRRWQHREMESPPLRTSRFPFLGVRGYVLLFYPYGCPTAKQSYCTLSIRQPENWGVLTPEINLFVEGVKRGPFPYRGRDFYQHSKNMCRYEMLDGLDEVRVGMEVPPIPASRRTLQLQG